MSHPTDPPPIAPDATLAGPPPAVRIDLVPFGEQLLIQVTSSMVFDRDAARNVGEAIVAAAESLPRIRMAAAMPRLVMP